MRRCLLQNLNDVEADLRAARRISLFLDFDGTLAPLVQDPAQARLDGRTRETLARLRGISRLTTILISGRALSDIRDRVGLEGLIYAGNHGMEICGGGLRFVEATAAARRRELLALSTGLAAGLRDVRGAMVEYKGLTTTVHYRRVAVGERARLVRVVRAAIGPASRSFRLGASEMAMEILPRSGWHKGEAVRWINQRLGAGEVLSLYLGDDLTDENAFRALPGGITVRVGRCTATFARYCVADPPAVLQFLTWLVHHVAP
jgi:trehalose-phosphatase